LDFIDLVSAEGVSESESRVFPMALQ
jgi:hypothetical protein